MFIDIHRFNFEWEIMEWFYKIGTKFGDFFFFFVSEFGASIGILAIITMIYWCINKEKGEKIAFISFVGMNLNSLLKGCFIARRPFQYSNKEYLRKLDGSILSDGASGTSFPSGHSQGSGTLYTTIFQYFKKKWVRILTICFIVLIPVSRLYLGVHFPIDVIVGSIIGILISIVFSKIINKYYKNKYIVYIISVSILIPFLFFSNKGNIDLQGMSKDFYKGMGVMCGCILGVFLEEKYVKFDIAKSRKTNILRYIFGIIVMLVIYLGVHVINHLDFIENIYWLLYLSNFITHAVIAVSAISFVPYLFTKIPFLKEGN